MHRLPRRPTASAGFSKRRSPPETTAVEDPPGGKEPGASHIKQRPQPQGPLGGKPQQELGYQKPSVSQSRRHSGREEAAVRFKPHKTRSTIPKMCRHRLLLLRLQRDGGNQNSRRSSELLLNKGASPRIGFLSICLEIPGELPGKC